MTTSGWTLREVPGEERSRYVANGWWSDETVGQLLAAKLTANRTLPFVIHSKVRPWRGTFGEVLDLSRRVARGLADRGVTAGDVVSFQTPNWLEGVATFYASALLGAVVVPIVHIYGRHELEYILRQSRPRVHVTATGFGHQDYLANLESIGDLPMDIVVIDGDGRAGTTRFGDLAASDPFGPPAHTDPGAPALIGWTSGTTANPKGVIHSHQTVGAEIRQGRDYSPPYRYPFLMANPISHAIGMQGALLMPVDRGFAVHLMDVWDPREVLDLMLQEHLSAAGGAPYFLTSLLDHPDLTDEHLEHLEFQGMGGAPVPRALAERATELGIVVFRAYGSTEHPSITGSSYADAPEKRLRTDGRPLLGVEVRLVDPTGREVDPGEPGEILSRGPDQFLGYTDAALTARAVDADGWYHTGDVGISDEDGYILITDRISDVIIRGGENISAAEIEELLLVMPGVGEVAVVAAPDARTGEHATAVIRMLGDQPAPELREIRTHLEEAGLARQKWPEEVLELDEFPRTASGKVQKNVLRERLRAR
jgi:acyl-CoA synthetase (AMP-forming)/AMP-acid ligase II